MMRRCRSKGLLRHLFFCFYEASMASSNDYSGGNRLIKNRTLSGVFLAGGTTPLTRTSSVSI